MEDLFVYNGSGVQAKRTWVIAPDPESLIQRWKALLGEQNPEQKQVLFHATLRDGQPADRHIRSVVREAIPGYEANLTSIAEEAGPSCVTPVRYAFRSFDRQWIIPDARVITQPNAELWRSRSGQELFLTAPSDRSPTNGPAISFAGLVPDLHHYNGRGGRVFPLWRDAKAVDSNLRPKLLSYLKNKYGAPILAEDLIAYIAAVAAQNAFTIVRLKKGALVEVTVTATDNRS